MPVTAPPPVPADIALAAPKLSTPLFMAADTYGCCWYRCILPARQVGGRVTQQMQLAADLQTGTLKGLPGLAPVTLVQRPADAAMPSLIRAIRQAGGEVVLELDDDIWALDALNNPIAQQWSKASRHNLIRAIKAADRATVSTPVLADVVRRWNKRVTVIPNGLDPDAMWTYRPQIERAIDPATGERREGETLRIGWAGSYSHMAELRLALPALVELAQRPDVELVFMGFDPFQPIKGGQQFSGVYEYGPPGHAFRYTYLDWSLDIPTHYARISGLDVACAPILDTAFNRSKSCLKFWEHAFWATPCVCSDVAPYREYVRHGETGFLARDERGFRKYLTALVDNARLRRDIGQAARRDVLAHHLMEHRKPLWAEQMVR